MLGDFEIGLPGRDGEYSTRIGNEIMINAKEITLNASGISWMITPNPTFQEKTGNSSIA